MLKVTLPDGTCKQYEQSVTAGDIAAEIGPGLAKAALAAVVNDSVIGLDQQYHPRAKLLCVCSRKRILSRWVLCDTPVLT